MHRIAAAAVAAALSITGIFASPALATTTSGEEWLVQAGSPPRFDDLGPSGAGNRFYPEVIAIHKGDHIAVAPMGPHTVTFNRPPGPVFALFGLATPSPATITARTDVVNGLIGFGPPVPPEPPFLLTFARPGTYKIICGLHLGMTLTVDVKPTGATLPKDHAQSLAIAQAEMTRDLASVDRIAAEATENFEDENGNPKVLVGAGNARVSNIRFFPASVTVRVGHTVTFLKTQDPTEPHTVSFNLPPPPTDPNDLSEFIASGGSSYDGTGVANSGWMSTREQFKFYQLKDTGLPVALTRYRLKFTRVGDFPYVCAIHDGAGMVGIVHVVLR